MEEYAMRLTGIILIALSGLACPAQQPASGVAGKAAAPAPAEAAALTAYAVQSPPATPDKPEGYVLGPGDQISVYIVDADQPLDKAYLVDMSGHVRLPMVGRVRVAGLTVTETEAELVKRLKAYFLKPDVTVGIAEYGSQPVSVIGAVKTPGVHQVRGVKTLVEVLSLAGGLDTNAGTTVNITRRIAFGAIPHPSAKLDASGQYSIAEVNLKSLIQAKTPEDNIQVRPQDVVSVPRADTIYVMGQVVRSGGYALNDHEQVTVLQALSMAGGMDRMAKPQEARILRVAPESSSRQEIAVDVKKIMDGDRPDVMLQPDDILLVPDNIPKRAFLRGLETAIQMGTGVVIWRR